MDSDSGRETPEAVFAALRAAEALVSRPAPESTGLHWEPGGTERQFVVAMLTSDDSVSESDHPFFGRVFVALRSRLMAMGCDLLNCARHPAMAEDMRVSRLEHLLERGIDGFVAMSVGYSSTEVKLALESGKPAVFIDFDPIGEHVGCIMSANVDAMAAVIDHLHRTGNRRIAYISGRLGTRPGVDRMLGYRSALDRLGLPLRDDYVHEGNFDLAAGFEGASRMLALSEPPDAIAAASDTQAVGAMVAIRQAGLRVPEDIAVTGFDDVDFASRLRPGLTTVRQDTSRIGAAAAEALVTMLDDPGSPLPTLLLPTELVVRESCGAALSDEHGKSGEESPRLPRALAGERFGTRRRS